MPPGARARARAWPCPAQEIPRWQSPEPRTWKSCALPGNARGQFFNPPGARANIHGRLAQSRIAFCADWPLLCDKLGLSRSWPLEQRGHRNNILLASSPPSAGTACNTGPWRALSNLLSRSGPRADSPAGQPRGCLALLPAARRAPCAGIHRAHLQQGLRRMRLDPRRRGHRGRAD